jgi:transcriptional regulator GlxA family with amidase domain
VEVRPDVLYVDDDDVLTSAGVSSGLDLCLHVLRKDLGAATRRRVAQALVAAPHRDGNQAQFIARPLEINGAGPIGELCTWITQDLRAEITLDAMAARCAMSTRTLTRQFREATGTTPLQWVLALRMDEARRMLETTDLAIDEIAERCGFGTTLSLRTHFRHRLDTTPTTYRRTFRTSRNGGLERNGNRRLTDPPAVPAASQCAAMLAAGWAAACTAETVRFGGRYKYRTLMRRSRWPSRWSASDRCCWF